MKTLLGIDYGDRKVGVAISGGLLAAPLDVVRFKSEESLLNALSRFIHKEHVDEIVVGVSAQESAQKALHFGETLKKHFHLPVHFQDEALSTVEAQMLSREAGMKRAKRKKKEDAFAAALILQSYLDETVI